MGSDVIIHTITLCVCVCVCVFLQARDGAALKETLHAERGATSAELEALRATVQKLESRKRETPPPGPVISQKEAEERKKAEEKAAQEILQLTQVGPPTHARHSAGDRSLFTVVNETSSF